MNNGTFNIQSPLIRRYADYQHSTLSTWSLRSLLAKEGDCMVSCFYDRTVAGIQISQHMFWLISPHKSICTFEVGYSPAFKFISKMVKHIIENREEEELCQ